MRCSGEPEGGRIPESRFNSGGLEKNNSEGYDSTFTKLLTLTNLKALLPFGVL